MTREEYAKLTPEEQRIKVAELCRFRNIRRMIPNDQLRGVLKDDEYTYDIPDYLNDLNAMHEAEKILTQGMLQDYLSYLMPMMKEGENETNEELWVERSIRATAAQRAEAFCLTMEAE